MINSLKVSGNHFQMFPLVVGIIMNKYVKTGLKSDDLWWF